MSGLKLGIKQLLLAMAFFSISLTLVSSFYVGYRANQKTLENITLEANLAYAKKLAQTTDDYIRTRIETLKFSAEEVSPYITNSNVEMLNREANRLALQTSSFSSALITDRNGVIQGTSQGINQLVGQHITKGKGIETLNNGVTSISDPYYSQTGRLLIFISTPILNSMNEVLGLVGGTIYLKEKNPLNEILGLG